MAEKSETAQKTNLTSGKAKRHKVWKIFVAIFLLLIICACAFAGWMYCYNNFSVTGNEEFGRRLDKAIEKAAEWVRLHKNDIINRRNLALIRMLQDADSLHNEKVFGSIVDNFLSKPMMFNCWKRLLDPNHPVRTFAINYTVENEVIDNKWILYAIAPEKVKLTKKQMEEFFHGDLWEQRKLTHQLWALIHLRRSKGPDEKVDRLIEHLCNRLSDELEFDVAVVDIYIQKIAFVLKAGHPEKIKRRWVERVIANQAEDSGWNDRWYCFRSRRRPIFDFANPPSNQHATVQGLWLLYQVKYRHPEHFGVKKTH